MGEAFDTTMSEAPSEPGRGQTLGEPIPIIKEKLLDRFATYLDGLDEQELESAAVDAGREESDLFSVFVELAGLRTEVRTQARLVKEALDQFRCVFDTLRASHTTMEQELGRVRAQMREQERAPLRPLLFEIIDVRDRLSAAIKASEPRPRWYAHFRVKLSQEARDAWQEGMRMIVRRIDRILADRRVVPTETVGRSFDPRIAAVVATVSDTSQADGTVVEELRPGFLWEGELLRPAEVIVAKQDRKGDET
jgi:molecular chaperone GrpE